MNLIAEQEGIWPRQRKKYGTFLGDFGSLGFAIAPLYSTFLHQDVYVSCHLACLLMLHCSLSRRAVDGNVQLPQHRPWLLREMAQAALHYCGSAHASPIQTTPSWALPRLYDEPYCAPSRQSCHFCDGTPDIACPECLVLLCPLHASDLRPSEICVGLRQCQVQICATIACTTLALALGDSSTVAKPPSTDEVRPKVLIRGKEFLVLSVTPKMPLLDWSMTKN